MSTKNRKTACALIETRGIDYDDRSDSRQFDVTLYAPTGQLFAANGAHSLVFHQYKGFGSAAVAEFWGDVIDHVRDGTRDCDIPYCDVCESNRSI